MKLFGNKKTQTPVETEHEALVRSLASYSGDSEEYGKVLENLDRLTEIKMKEKTSEESKLHKVGSKIFDAVTDPRVWVACITSAVYVWWGDRCMKYDEDGHIPPNRMMGNGPRAPRVS